MSLNATIQMESVFRVISKVRGYHVYQSIWPNPLIGEVVSCRRETGNAHDPQAVAMIKLIDGEMQVVGHVPRTISSVCSIFIRRGGNIVCKITGSREYSSDLDQGGLQLPCELTFSIADSQECKKTRKSFKILSVDTYRVSESMEIDEHTEPCSSMLKVTKPASDKDLIQCSSESVSQGIKEQRSFVDLSKDEDVHSPQKKRSKLFDSEGLIMGNELSADEINLAQQFLKEQYSNLNGLKSTFLQSKQLNLTENETKNKLQIIHCYSRHHWVVASTVGCTLNQVKVYDSLFSHCDMETEAIVDNLFQWSKSIKLVVTVSRSQKQKGTADCGLFAIANATAIAHGKNPSKLQFKQESMRAHLVHCFDCKQMSLFPCK